jgi:uncharacterized protein
LAMLSIDIRSLEARAVHVEGELAADDPVWEEGDPLPAGPVHVAGRLSTAGEGRYYFSGEFEGTAIGECRRCLTDVRTPVAEEAHLFFMEADSDGAEDDPDTYVIDPRAHAIDLRPAIRELWLLSVPAFAQCREDCRGLCPSCGSDLNAGDCECPPVAADSRWDALRKIRSDAR